MKNKRAVEKGKTGPVYGWVIPATQKRKADAADAVNELRRQGLEVHKASAAFKAGTVDVKAGDYVVRGDQPYRTIADMYFSVQNYAPSNPRPVRRHRLDVPVHAQPRRSSRSPRRARSRQQMAAVTADVRAPGGIEGTGPVLVVDHTTDNNLVTFRFKHADVKMEAARRGVRGGRPEVPRRLVHHSQRATAPRSSRR